MPHILLYCIFCTPRSDICVEARTERETMTSLPHLNILVYYCTVYFAHQERYTRVRTYHRTLEHVKYATFEYPRILLYCIFCTPREIQHRTHTHAYRTHYARIWCVIRSYMCLNVYLSVYKCAHNAHV